MSEVKVIDGYKAVRLIDQQVQKKGKDYLYKEEFKVCTYFQYDTDEDVPRCIVGHVFADLKIPRSEVIEIDAANALSDLNDKDDVDYRFTKVAILAFAAAQGVQDSGGTWGVALTTAEAIRDSAISLGVSDE